VVRETGDETLEIGPVGFLRNSQAEDWGNQEIVKGFREVPKGRGRKSLEGCFLERGCGGAKKVLSSGRIGKKSRDNETMGFHKS